MSQRIVIEASREPQAQRCLDLSSMSRRHIVNWNFASDDWCCPHSLKTICGRVAGSARAWKPRTAASAFDFEATYDEVRPRS